MSLWNWQLRAAAGMAALLLVAVAVMIIYYGHAPALLGAVYGVTMVSLAIWGVERR